MGLPGWMVGCEIDDTVAEAVLPEVPVEGQEGTEPVGVNQGEVRVAA